MTFYCGNTEIGLSALPQTGSTVDANIYGLAMLKEVEDEIQNSTYSQSGLISINVLGDNSSVSPLPNSWIYKPSSLAEYYQDILTCDHTYAEQKLKEILGNN